jgi:hypothetical protein
MSIIEPLRIHDSVLDQFTSDEQYLLSPKKSVVKGMEAVIKLHKNKQASDKNPFISWTLNKVAVIDNNWLKSHKDNMPIEDMDWWRVKVENETSPGQPVGCFIVRPLWKVLREDLAILAPSTWTQVQSGLTILLYPKIKPWMPWIIPKALRKLIMRKSGGSALLIPLSYPPEGEPEIVKNEVGFTPLYTHEQEPEDMQLDEFMIDIISKE